VEQSHLCWESSSIWIHLESLMVSNRGESREGIILLVSRLTSQREAEHNMVGAQWHTAGSQNSAACQ
jgi:hypothetical protein